MDAMIYGKLAQWEHPLFKPWTFLVLEMQEMRKPYVCLIYGNWYQVIVRDVGTADTVLMNMKT